MLVFLEQIKGKMAVFGYERAHYQTGDEEQGKHKYGFRYSVSWLVSDNESPHKEQKQAQRAEEVKKACIIPCKKRGNGQSAQSNDKKFLYKVVNYIHYTIFLTSK